MVVDCWFIVSGYGIDVLVIVGWVKENLIGVVCFCFVVKKVNMVFE